MADNGTDDGNVIPLKQPADELAYWVCACGCMTHHIRSTGDVECASCAATPAEPGYYLYYLRLPNGIVRDTDAAESPAFTVGTVYGDFTTKRFADRVAAGEFLAVIGIREDGRVGAHSIKARHETPEQRAWLRRRLRDAYKIITGG